MLIPKESSVSIHQLRRIVHHELLDLRRIEHIITGVTFEAIFTTSQNQSEAVKLIEKLDVEGLLKWIKMQIEEDIGDYNIRTLRWIASTMHVPRYSFMSKAELLSEITAREKARTTAEIQRNGNQS